eukprot:jgi/Bigna1/130915/aug1.12_g5623
MIRLLPKVIEKRDICGRDYRHSRGVNYYLDLLKDYLILKYPIPFDQKRQLARILYGFITAKWATQHTECMALAAYCLTKILKKKDVTGLTLPWKPFYETLLRYVDDPRKGKPNRVFNSPQQTLKICCDRLVQLGKKLRMYYPKTATKEITELFLPKLEPFTDEFSKHQALLCLLLPVKHGKNNVEMWLPKLMEVSRWKSDKVSMAVWYKLWARLAKHNIDVVDLSPYLPDLFSRYLQGIGLGRGNPNKGSEHGFPARFMWLTGMHPARANVDEHMAKLIIFTIHLDKCRQLLSNLCQITSTSFHPSNAGAHLRHLSVLLSGLGCYYARRKQLFLQGKPYPEQISKFFVATLLPIATMGMYSKAFQMVAATQSFLRNVGSVNPDSVLPSLIDQWCVALGAAPSAPTISYYCCHYNIPTNVRYR